jgi:hypothetical protein
MVCVAVFNYGKDVRWFPRLHYLMLNNGPSMIPIVAQAWIQLSHENGVVSVVNKLNSLWPGVGWFKFCIHLRSLNFRHFGTVEGTRLKIMASRSSSTA